MDHQWHDLLEPPALPGLYARGALPRRVTGKRLPALGLRCELSAEARRLQRYRELCGFADNAYLPPTYPHVLAFALQMKLLTDRRFPFPLLGLVHLENRIRVLRPLGGYGPFTVSVHTQALRGHDKGAQFSLITRLHDQLGLLWEGDSGILCRGVQIEGEAPDPAAPVELPMRELARWTAPANIGRRYARVSGDYNPIHLSAASARLFGFPRAIAHGLWLKARSLAALEGLLPAAGCAVTVRFQQPVRLPAQLCLQASPAGPLGRFELRGEDQRLHMSGGWQPSAAP